MSKAKHMPGPWAVDKNGLSGYGDNGNTFNVIGRGGEAVASLPSSFRLLDTNDGDTIGFRTEQANAHLIAAAPTLLEAVAMSTAELMKAAARLQALDNPVIANAVLAQCDFNRAVIAKTEGRS